MISFFPIEIEIMVLIVKMPSILHIIIEIYTKYTQKRF